MNLTEHLSKRANAMNRMINWTLLHGCVLFLLAGTALGQPMSTYVNNAIVTYPGTLGYVPVIDATNFVNNSTFNINYTFPLTFSSGYTEAFETSDTINFTNNGTMAANTGFNFDTQSTYSGFRSMAGNFYNPSTISCGSGNSLIAFYLFGYSYFNLTPAYFNAWATNILNPGTVDVGVDGLMQFTGQNVNLNRSRLLIDGSGLFNSLGGLGYFFNLGVNGVAYAIGTDTNKDWIPSFDLGPTSAFSSAPVFMSLSNSVSYVDVNNRGTNSRIVRAVYIMDTTPNVSSKVYFGQNTVGPGGATIEWTGTYLDAASGSTMANYLYLNNDYIIGSSTNAGGVYNGIPGNFFFYTSPSPLNYGLPTPPSLFFNYLPIGATVTNTYSYVDAQLISSTVGTNAIANQAITNLPGRVQITASKDLDLSLAEITGANYLSIQATNQFDGSAGAYIAVPYADINVGVTNGCLVLTNLLAAGVPNWGGEIQAWSGRWIYLDPAGVTNDYRVLLVFSHIVPTSSSQVQDLILHATNSVVINDTFNISRTFSSDAQSLTLMTNLIGTGATSPDGELNIISPAFDWQHSLPNLINLTNNGAIRMVNQANIGGPLVINSVTTVPAIAATATLSRSVSTVTNVAANDKLVIGTNRYAFVGTLTNTVANQVKIAATLDASLTNLIAAINHTSGSGSVYSSATAANPFVTAGALSGHAFTVTAVTNGTPGNGISVLTAYTSNVTWGASSVLAGGVNAIPGSTNVVSFPYANIINNGLMSDQAAFIYSTNFVSSGLFSNGVGSFTLKSINTTLTNGVLVAGGDVSITAASLITSNLILQAGRSLTIQATNLLTDDGLSSSNIWTVGIGSVGVGLNVNVKPPIGDLLGTTITNYAPTNTSVLNTWAGTDRGVSIFGYTNNLAVGRLILDVMPGAYSGHYGSFVFQGAGTKNALYVDYLELRDYATNGGRNNNTFDFPWLTINTNLVIYFAQAVMNGVSVAENIDYASRFQGANGGRLRWIASYAGQYSSTNVAYPNGTTNAVNAALAAANDIDSNGNGIANINDPTPMFLPYQTFFTGVVTNNPARVRLQWATIPLATNSISYRTNLQSGDWLPLTNFSAFYYSTNLSVPVPNPANGFASPQNYPGPATNVWIYDPVTNLPHYYRVLVQPWVTYPY